MTCIDFLGCDLDSFGIKGQKWPEANIFMKSLSAIPQKDGLDGIGGCSFFTLKLDQFYLKLIELMCRRDCMTYLNKWMPEAI